MKKLLLILLCIPLFAQGQMKITPVLGEKFAGYTFNYKLYQPKEPSVFWLIFYHGKGELGPKDGSLINKVEAHGYPMHASKGFEFPFNIIAVQAETSYNSIRHFFPSFVKLKYGAGVIIVTGLSLGGYATTDTRTYDNNNLVYAIAVVCGGGNGLSKEEPFLEVIKKWPETRGWFFHGDQDGTVNYRSSQGPVNAYNAVHTTKIKYTLYPGVGHNAWDKAYSVKPGEDELLQQINKWFNEAPRSGGNVEAIKRLNSILHQMKNNVNSLDSNIWHIRQTFDSAIHKQ